MGNVRPFTATRRCAGNFRGRGSSASSPRSRFGLLVAGSAAAAFLGVYYSDQLSPAFRWAIAASRNVDRDGAPPKGAYYLGCNEARAAGVAPIYAGEPGYREEMDGDLDGIACEPHRIRF